MREFTFILWVVASVSFTSNLPAHLPVPADLSCVREVVFRAPHRTILITSHMLSPESAFIQAALARTYTRAEWEAWREQADFLVPHPRRVDSAAVEMAANLQFAINFFRRKDSQFPVDKRQLGGFIDQAIAITAVLEQVSSSPLTTGSWLLRRNRELDLDKHDHLSYKVPYFRIGSQIALPQQPTLMPSDGFDPLGPTRLLMWDQIGQAQPSLTLSAPENLIPLGFFSLKNKTTLGIFTGSRPELEAGKCVINLATYRLGSGPTPGVPLRQGSIHAPYPSPPSCYRPLMLLSPNERFLILAKSEVPLMLINPENYELIKATPKNIRREEYLALQFSADSNRLLVASNPKKPRLTIYHVPSLTIEKEFQLEDGMWPRWFDPFWADLVSAGRGRFWLYADHHQRSIPLLDMESMELSHLNYQDQARPGETVSVAGHPSRAEALSIAEGMLHFWKLGKTPKLQKRIKLPSFINASENGNGDPIQDTIGGGGRVYYSSRANYILVVYRSGGVALLEKDGTFVEYLYSKDNDAGLESHKASFDEDTGIVIETLVSGDVMLHHVSPSNARLPFQRRLP